VNTRNVVATLLALTLISVLAGCGEKERTQTVTWWALPDRVGSEDLAKTCTDIARGYRIEVRLLPSSLEQRRADVIRRLSAGDETVDILTVDAALTAELAAAKFLTPPPADLTRTAGVLPPALAAASYRGRPVAVPWWVDPYLLWYRGAAAERAGIDVNKPVSWNRLLAGADRVRASVQMDDTDGTGLSDWVRGLVAEAGGTVLQGTGRNPKVDVAGAAGRSAAGVVQFYAASGLGAGPTPGAAAEFAGSRGAFLIGRASVRSQPVLAQVAADMRPLRYPVINNVSAAPMSAAALAVPRSSDQRQHAYAAVRCLASANSQQRLMVNAGVGAARVNVYSDPTVIKAMPFAAELLAAAQAAQTPPSSPYWHHAERAIDATWAPLSGVRTGTTPKKSDAAVVDAVGGGL
jgi:multiple sugar transport system substrate-binding protein